MITAVTQHIGLNRIRHMSDLNRVWALILLYISDSAGGIIDVTQSILSRGAMCFNMVYDLWG